MLPITEKPQTHSAAGVMGWKIWYGDGRVCIGRTLEDWNHAPHDDVQFIMLYKDEQDGMGRPLRHAISGADYYAFDGRRFQHANDTRVLSGTILYGKWATDEIYTNIDRQAMKDYGI